MTKLSDIHRLLSWILFTLISRIIDRKIKVSTVTDMIDKLQIIKIIMLEIKDEYSRAIEEY